MKKTLLLTVLFALITTLGFSQTDKFWTASTADRASIVTDKAVARLSFPKEFRLFNLDQQSLRNELFTIVGDNAQKRSTVITLPNVQGKMEQFEVFEASNFEPALQAKFPEIRAFSGRGITDRAATLKLSISPQGIQTMIFRTETANEFIEPYSKDHTTYAVFVSSREKGKLPWTCTTQDHQIFDGISSNIPSSNITGSSTGELRTFRLAQSCNGEYANWFGATSSAQVGLVLAAFNNTLTRTNGCYEKDLALHLNLIANTTDVIYYNPATDPYTTLGQWNTQLMNTLHNIIGDANFDIGHMFGASGGGGNAGCIGCVCNNTLATGGGANNSYKGAGITSPADGIPQGDNFDIDYVAHEVGHQLGGNHTFSHVNENTNVNKEVGSGITIMGYAGITNQDVAPHSIDIFHQASIAQIQANMATRTCPVVTNITAANATPVVDPVSNYTIPISTPFALTGSATDANAGDVLTYCWEQNDNTTTTGNASVASPTKVTGPNWLTFPATTSPTRLMPRLSTILAGLFITPVLPGGDAIANIEALSSVSRTLNFRLTVRDNSPYSSAAPIKVGQTAFTDMVVTVTNTSGPFRVTVANTAGTTYPGGSTQTITWDVAGTTGAPVSCANVRILMSTDGGQTFPTVLAANTANDGSEAVTIPGTNTTTARIKIESVGNIFFDINDANFSVSGACPAPTITTQPANVTVCPTQTANFSVVSPDATGYQWQVSTDGGTNYANVATGGTTASYAVTGVTAGMNNNRYRVILTNACGTFTSNAATLTVNSVPSITTQPVAASVCATFNTSFTAGSTGTGVTSQWQVSTDNGTTWTNVANGGVYSGATTGTLTITGATTAMNGYCYRMVATGTCAPAANSNSACLTVIVPASVTQQPANASICSGGTITFTVAGANTSVYKWQESIDGGTTWTTLTNTAPYSGVTTSTLTITNVPTGFASPVRRYRALLSNANCTADIASNAATLSIIPRPSATLTPNPSNAIAYNQTTTLTANVANGNANTIITWYYNGAVLPGVTGTTYVVDVDHLGVYQVMVSDPTGTCSSLSNRDTVTAAPNNRMFITPNPNRGVFQVRFYSSAQNFGFNRQVTIYDSKGARIFSQPIAINGPYSAMNVDISKRGKGLYILVLSDYKGNELATGKVIVE